MKIQSRPSRTPRQRLRASVAALTLVLLAACGGGEQATDEQVAAAFNSVSTTANGAGVMDGSFERTKGYLSQGNTVLRGLGAGNQTAQFRLQVPRTGYYEVFAWWPQAADGAGVVEATVLENRRATALKLDQSQLGGQWNSLGIFELDSRGGELVLRSGTGVRLLADAVRVTWVGMERPELRLDTTDLPVADRDDHYETMLVGWGGRGPFRFSLTKGVLPDGLTFDGATGRLSGVPAEAGSFMLQFSVIDADQRSAQGELSLEVVQSNDTPSSVQPRPFRLEGDRKKALATTSTASTGAALGALPDILRAQPEGTWAKVNLNNYSDAWVPADLRPLYLSSNPTPAKIISAWSSFAWDTKRGNLLLYGGGHANYRGNEVYQWRASTQRWERASLPSEMRQDTLGNWNAIDGADAAPASAHTYDNTLYLPYIDRVVVVGGAADSNGGHFLRLNPATGTSRITGFYMFDPERAHPDRVGGSTGSHVRRVAPWPEIEGGNMWANRDTFINAASATVLKNGWVNGCSANVPAEGKDVVYFRNANSVFRLTITDRDDPSTDLWQVVGVKWSGSGTKATCTYDPHQQVLLRTATQTVPFVFWSMATAGPSNRCAFH